MTLQYANPSPACLRSTQLTFFRRFASLIQDSSVPPARVLPPRSSCLMRFWRLVRLQTAIAMPRQLLRFGYAAL
jgi:hypothetical protein